MHESTQVSRVINLILLSFLPLPPSVSLPLWIPFLLPLHLLLCLLYPLSLLLPPLSLSPTSLLPRPSFPSFISCCTSFIALPHSPSLSILPPPCSFFLLPLPYSPLSSLHTNSWIASKNLRRLARCVTSCGPTLWKTLGQRNPHKRTFATTLCEDVPTITGSSCPIPRPEWVFGNEADTFVVCYCFCSAHDACQELNSMCVEMIS